MSQGKFEKAAAIIQSLPKDGPVQPTQADQLHFYKYYKQATIGDVNTTRPGLLDFTGKAKWDAWESVKGTTKTEAYTKYVDKLIEILNAVNDETSKKYLAEIEGA